MPPVGILVFGLVQGSLAAVNSLSLVMLWRTTRLVNLAQPSMGLVGGVLTGLLVVAGGWSFWWAAPAGLLLGAGLGYLADRLVLRRLQDAPRAVLLIATIGLAQVFGGIQAALPFIFGGTLPTYTIDIGFTIDVFPARLLGAHILILIVMPVALLGTHFFLHRTRVGLAATALGQDAERARALGIPAGVVRSVVWAVAGTLATVSGILAIPALGFNLGGGLGPTVLLFALAPAVFAALRSLVGAAVAALALGVAYQVILWYGAQRGIADLLLAGVVLVAVAAQRARLGREATAARASAWEAAATPRPVPRAVVRSPQVRSAAYLFGAVAIVAGIIPPMLLTPSKDLLFATSAAVALGALAVSVAWMFAGEVVLGHWGIAGFGAAVSTVVPGPWPGKVLAAGLAMSAGGALLAVTSRHQSTLSFAVIGLAAAAAAPSAVLQISKSVPADTGQVAMFAGGFAMFAAILVARLRSTRTGLRMVAARDDPQRAPWLGADPFRSRVVALTISGGLAGIAGALFIWAIPGVAPGAFDAVRSLDLLAMAVVGGLGSPLGAVAGAVALEAARIMLPGPWSLLASGVGVLFVVIFLPSGLGGPIAWIRDRAVRFFAGPGAPAPQAGGLHDKQPEAVPS